MQYCYCRGEDLASEATSKDGHPLLSAKRRGKKFELSVLSMEYADRLLKSAAAKKLMELRLCLEGTEIINIKEYLLTVC